MGITFSHTPAWFRPLVISPDNFEPQPSFAGSSNNPMTSPAVHSYVIEDLCSPFNCNLLRRSKLITRWIEAMERPFAYPEVEIATMIIGLETAQLWWEYAGGDLAVRPLSQPPTSLRGSPIGPILNNKNCYFSYNQLNEQVTAVRTLYPNVTQLDIVVPEMAEEYIDLLDQIRSAYLGQLLHQINLWAYHRQADNSVQALMFPLIVTDY